MNNELSKLSELPQQNGTTDIGGLVLAPENMRNIISFSEFMAQGTVMIPDHLKGKPADCMAIVLQAMQWNMSPFQVAQKTHLVSGTLGYEAQLVNSVISSSTAITGRFHYDYSDGWENLNGKVAIKKVEKNGKNGKYFVDQPCAEWQKEDELGLWVRVGAVLRGESDIQWGEKLFLANVLTRNSPLWVTKPDQQAAYLAVKYWARIYTPAVIMGVYTSDELQDIPAKEPKDVTPKAMSLDDLTGTVDEEQELDPSPAVTETVDDDLQAVLDAITGAHDKASLQDAAQKARALPDELQLKAMPAYQDKLDELRRLAAAQTEAGKTEPSAAGIFGGGE